MTTRRLTRAQLDALARLHYSGELSRWSDGCRFPTRYALECLGLSNGAAIHVLTPRLQAYTNGFGLMVVNVPHSVHPDDRAAVARAVIRGELGAREGVDTFETYRPRVRFVNILVRPHNPIVSVYREV